ncbi:hypothetical protein [Streptomyces rimosus]|uniref:hypothetical protein n=1 Tax=Streptomyces rimosus TaxID=1927 RepID=UPI00131E7126|nr:hypothetical protein [Streptomyces rimosus]
MPEGVRGQVPEGGLCEQAAIEVEDFARWREQARAEWVRSGAARVSAQTGEGEAARGACAEVRRGAGAAEAVGGTSRVASSAAYAERAQGRCAATIAVSPLVRLAKASGCSCELTHAFVLRLGKDSRSYAQGLPVREKGR